jgi:hypothetical protein
MAKRLWPWAWHAWVTGVLASFAVLEWLAFRRRTHRTLSRVLQDWLGVAPRRRWGRLGPLAFASGWIALTIHVIRLKAEPGDG